MRTQFEWCPSFSPRVHCLHTGVLPSVANAEARMFEVVSHRQLVELAKAQAAEVSILRTEVERLRMKTFPALVQVENL